MNRISKKLSHSLKWLSLESIIYQAIFLLHQICLLKITGYKLYGAIGALFSIIYLTVTITSFGLESSLSPFFKEISTSKKSFFHFFTFQFSITLLLALLSIPIILLLKLSDPSIFSHQTNLLFMLIIPLLILSESIKKTLRAILYLSFKNKINMTIEIISLLCYVATIWAIYLTSHTVSLYTIFTPMLLMSLTSNSLLFTHVYRYYEALPENLHSQAGQDSSKNLSWRPLKTRSINFANQFSHSLFSSNFLVPFFAFQFGLAQAGIFKLLSHVSYSISMLMRKIFGWSSDALLSQTKDLSMEEKQHIFSQLNQKINHAIIALIIFFMINTRKIATFYAPATVINWPLIYFFLMITLTENLFISYEKFYIVEEKNSILLILNLFSTLTLFAIISYSSYLSQPLLLFLILLSRATFFVILALISFAKWQIRPQIQIKPLYLATFTLISLVFFTIF